MGRIKPGSNYARSLQRHRLSMASGSTLAALFDLAVRRGADVRFNIETKISPNAAGETLLPEPSLVH